MNGRVKRLAANDRGRDFVVGDIHGAFDLVIKGMKMVSFDPTFDRLFVVGDLIDRGPGSHRVRKFLEKPYVEAVRGNHDHDFCQVDIPTLRVLGQMNWNGLRWVCDLPDSELLDIQEALSKLPIVMEVGTSRGVVGIVHADIPAGLTWQQFTEAIERGDESTIETALTGRDRVQGRDDQGVQGIDRIFVGHTIQWDGPRQLGNVYCVDTGAVFRELDKDRGALTMVNMACRTGCLVPAGTKDAVITEAEAASGPFGSYSTSKPSRPRP